jgi:hypothetical protein
MPNFYLKYKDLFEFGSRVSIQHVKLNPQNFYRISRYETVSGDTKSLVGNESSLIFAIGIFENKVNCIKLNEIRPELFLGWVPTILRPAIKEVDIDEYESTRDIVIKNNITGNNLFESKIRNKPIYNTNPRPYRTYDLSGLKYIQEIKLKKQILKEML